MLSSPFRWEVKVDGAGKLSHRRRCHAVRMVSPAGIITTVAGNGTSGYSGDGDQPPARKQVRGALPLIARAICMLRTHGTTPFDC